jgi:hypothetical protein
MNDPVCVPVPVLESVEVVCIVISALGKNDLSVHYFTDASIPGVEKF